jgi:four helix bundle protein
MRDPAKLDVVPASEDLALAVYNATQSFPRDERFGLTAQLRRSAVSVGSNVVEGCHRQGPRAFTAFLFQALGSAGELEFQLRLAGRLGFGDKEALKATLDQANRVKRMLIKLLVAVRKDLKER